MRKRAVFSNTQLIRPRNSATFIKSSALFSNTQLLRKRAIFYTKIYKIIEEGKKLVVILSGHYKPHTQKKTERERERQIARYSANFLK